jgi:hypothetical protein
MRGAAVGFAAAAACLVGCTQPYPSTEVVAASTRPVPQPVTVSRGVRIVDACPPPGESIGDVEAHSREQDALLPTLAAVQTYIKPELGASSGTRNVSDDSANPSTSFGAAGMAVVDGTVVVFVEAVGGREKLEEHAAALTQLVPQPDRVVICGVRLSEERGKYIQETLLFRYVIPNVTDERFYFADRDADVVTVRPRSDGEPLAELISDEFGDEVTIRVGNFMWPSATITDTPELCRPDALTIGTGLAGTWELPEKLTITSGAGELITGTFTRKEPGETPRPKAVITGLDSMTPLAIDAAAVFEYESAELRTTPEIRARVATDSCDPTLGYKLPPGQYRVFLVDRNPQRTPVISPAIPLTVTE